MAVRTRRQRKQDDAEKKKRWPYAAAAAIIAIVAAHYYNATVIRSDDLGTGSMFDRIAPHYDKANDFMSLGLHHGWREALIDVLDISKTDRALDLATGTADVAILQGKRGATVLGVDPSQNMLEIGRGKVTEAGLDDVVRLELGDATALQLNSSIYDKITISFGIRNILDVDQALREMRRVARPGALLGVLEFALPESGLLAPVARAFVSVVVPVLGAVLSGARFDEYAHLARSIAEFPSPDKFRERIAAAGFEAHEPQLFACGAVVLYVATAV